MHPKNFIKNIEKQRFSFITGFLSLFAIIIFRNIIEGVFEGSQMLGFTPMHTHSFYMIFVHFALFYISLFLWILFVFMLLTREKWINIVKVLLVSMAVIIIAPIIDIIVSKGSGYNLSYLKGFEQLTEIHKFFDFTRDLMQASWGQRIEILLVLSGGFIYVLIKTKNYFKSIIASIIIYLIIFVHGVLPNTIAKIPSYLGTHTLSFKTIITNGILPIDSQNYAVIFALSTLLAGFFIFKHNKEQLIKTTFNLKSSGVFLIVLCLGIGYGIILISPYYPFVFYSPISYLIFVLALFTICITNAVSYLNNKAADFHILVVTSILCAIVLGPMFLLFMMIFSIIRRLHFKWLAFVPIFFAGFALIFQEATFTSISPIYPQSIEIKGRKLAGWCYFLNADYDKALNEYQRLYTLKKDDEILKRLGQTYLNLGERNQGIQALEEIKDPDHETYLSLGQAYTQIGNFHEAIGVYEEAIERRIEPADFYIKIAKLAARRGLKNEMLQATRNASLYGSAKYEIYQIKGDFYLGQGRLTQALSMYDKAIDYNTRAVNALAGRGIVYYNMGDISRAENEFLRALEIEPQNDALYNNLGALYLITNKLAQAEQLFKKSIRKNPNQYEAYYNLGLIYEKMGQAKDALTMYHKALEVNPSYVPALRKIEGIE